MNIVQRRNKSEMNDNKDDEDDGDDEESDSLIMRIELQDNGCSEDLDGPKRDKRRQCYLRLCINSGLNCFRKSCGLLSRSPSERRDTRRLLAEPQVGPTSGGLIVICSLLLISSVNATTNNRYSPFSLHLNNNYNRQPVDQQQWSLVYFPQTCAHPTHINGPHYHRSELIEREHYHFDVNHNQNQNTDLNHRNYDNLGIQLRRPPDHHNQQQPPYPFVANQQIDGPPQYVPLRVPLHQKTHNLQTFVARNELNLFNQHQTRVEFQQNDQRQQQRNNNDNEQQIVELIRQPLQLQQRTRTQQQQQQQQNEQQFNNEQFEQKRIIVNNDRLAAPLQIITTTTTTTTTTNTSTETETNEQSNENKRKQLNINLITQPKLLQVDIDECLDKQSCGKDALCENLPGSFRCSCPSGYTGDPAVECIGKLILISRHF